MLNILQVFTFENINHISSGLLAVFRDPLAPHCSRTPPRLSGWRRGHCPSWRETCPVRSTLRTGQRSAIAVAKQSTCADSASSGRRGSTSPMAARAIDGRPAPAGSGGTITTRGPRGGPRQGSAGPDPEDRKARRTGSASGFIHTSGQSRATRSLQLECTRQRVRPRFRIHQELSCPHRRTTGRQHLLHPRWPHPCTAGRESEHYHP